MRSALILVAVTGGLAISPLYAEACPCGDSRRYISLGSDAIDAASMVAAQHGRPIDLVAADHDVAVIAIDEHDLGALAQEIHERTGRCGGFMLHDSLGDAEDALARADDVARPVVDYTLDREAAVRTVLPALDAERIRDTIRELSTMPTRYFNSPGGAAASIWLRDRWRSLTSRRDVTVELFDTGYPQKSVILTIPGGARASEVIVIGGHLDSIVLNRLSGPAPGADDDASGIATMTEVLRVLLAHDFRPDRTLQFMAYAAEEVGLRGSLQIARDYQRRHVDVVGALQLDMTNYQGSDRDIWLMKDFTSAAQNTFLALLIETYVGATWGFDACGYACSDHAAWHRIGVPASLPFEARMRDANRAIHTGKDTLETSDRNAAHALKFARLAAAYAIELGKGEIAAPGAMAASPASPPVISAPASASVDDAAGSPGHLAAAASVALLILGLWLARAAINRAG